MAVSDRWRPIGAYLADQLTIRCLHRNYDLPHWAKAMYMVICSSHSGNTEETLSSFNKALRKIVRFGALHRGRLQARQRQRIFRCGPLCIPVNAQAIPYYFGMLMAHFLPPGTGKIDELINFGCNRGDEQCADKTDGKRWFAENR
jgi:hypothetical protein